MKYNVTYVYDHAVITITVNAPNQDLAEISADEMLGNWGGLNDVTVDELKSDEPNQETLDRQTYKWLAHDVKMMQGMENFLSLAEKLEEEETEPNKKLLNDLDDWTMYCWESWVSSQNRMKELEEKYPKFKSEEQ